MKTDDDIQRDVMAELKAEPSIGAAHIGVSATEGIVSLSGWVASYVEKMQAEEATKRVHGVKAIANDLRVKLPGYNQRTDEDIAEAAVKALRANAMVPADRITVTVSKGWIKLEGDADANYQRDEAANAVRCLTGVVGVRNFIAVKPRPSPESINRAIEETQRRGARSS